MKKLLLPLVLFPLSMTINAETGESCAKLSDKDKRLECYDSIFMAKEVSSVEPKNTEHSQKGLWYYSEEKDEMRGKTNYIASLWSQNKVKFSFPYQGGSQVEVMLRKHSEYGDDIMITINKGQFNSCFNGCKMAVKFDDNKIEYYPLVRSDSGLNSVLFISNDKNRKKFTEKLKKSKKMILELSFFNHGKEQFTFDVSNLEWKYF